MTKEFISRKTAGNFQKPTSQFAPRPFATPQQKSAKAEYSTPPNIQCSPESSDRLSRIAITQPEPFTPQLKVQRAEQVVANDNPGEEAEKIQRSSNGNNRFEKISIQPPEPPSTPRFPIQAKLTVGAAGDKYEQEPDYVARQVVNRIHAPQVNLNSSESNPVQRKISIQAFGGEGGDVSSEWESELNRARGGGQPLSLSLREPMEREFGADFSGVRVHTGAQADNLAKTIQAKAFTTGQDVFFRQGAYEPGSRGGQELIAHELTHVVQQSGGAVGRSPATSIETPLATVVEKRLHPTVSQSTLQRVVHGSFIPASYAGATSHVDISGLWRAVLGIPVPPLVLNSQILRENLTLFGGVPDSNNSPVSTGNQAHHIVELNDVNAAPARQLLGLAGIHLNSAINGVLLPTAIADDTGDATVHVGSHIRQYAINVNLALDNAIDNDPIFMALGWTANWLRALVGPLPLIVQRYLRGIITNRLAQIRTFLLTHHIPINKGYKMDEDYDPDEDRASGGKKDKWGHSGGKTIGKSFADFGLV